MIKSLRGQWLAWQALLLALVLGGFGTALYLETRKAHFDEVDAELLAAARVLEGSMRPFAGPQGDRPPPGVGGRPPFDKRGEPPPFGKPGDQPPRRPPLNDRDRLARALNLPKSFAEKYHDIETPPYFAVWRPDGDLIKASDTEQRDKPEVPDEATTYYTRHAGPVHEVVLLGPAHSPIVVGRSVERELAQMRQFGLRLALTGMTVFLAGLAGGWWISGQAVRPIAAMSATAERVTANRLSERMDLAGVASELAGLGSSVNTMLDRLEDAFAQQVRFTADASHELRTPLSILLSHLELALEKPRSAAEYQETLATCERASRRMKGLTEGLLMLARVDAGKLELQTQPVDLAAAAEETVSLLAGLAKQRDVTVTIHGEPVEVQADPDRLAQIILNIVTNALYYNRPNGTVTVSTSKHGNVGVLTVTDTGRGISAQVLPHIFERFYRVDVARTRERGGSGLGLAIVKGLVDAHGGTLEVASNEGKGSTFTVRLPLAE